MVRHWLAVAVCAAAVTRLVGAGEATFRRHALNPHAAYHSCAVFDVNRDGKLDVVCGGEWFEAPDWRRHRVRDVEMIGGRYDDYSALPLDVNGDGWTDLISVNYRSRSLYWVEHPGTAAGDWAKHVIDTPGPMETGRLADVDGDGRPDVLANSTQFAAWWELLPQDATGRGHAPRWVRRDLPQEITGHGLGAGDINGDGRSDLVGPRGWLEAPQDRRLGRWLFRAEFELDRDASIPILVHDVDRDGDNDLVWGRGHRTGLYWLEQARDRGGRRCWVRHTIDTSWSQPHTLLLADLDRDGQEDLVAGKRYLGHDGKDPGEYDPLVVFWYGFDRRERVWRRHPVSEGVGFGLDPKAEDLDADGDIDLVAADRSGLYWLENLLVDGPSELSAAHGPGAPPEYADHARLLVYRDGRGALRPVESPFHVGIRRAHILAGMQAAMGPLPDSSRRVPLDVKIAEEKRLESYLQRRITYAAEAGDRVPAYLLLPSDSRKRLPAMLCLHQTIRIGKDEPAGLGGSPNLHYAAELARRGYVCIVPDYPSFGEYAYDFQQHRPAYASGSMKAIWNNLRAVDLLETLPEVDRDRIGAIGHSLGGHNALFTAAFDLRLRAVVTSCGFTAFHHYYGGKLAGWTSDRYMPRIRDVYRNDPDRVPFDFYEVLAAIAPRGVFINAPQRDSNFDIAGVKKVVAEVHRVYGILGAEERLVAAHPDCEHDFPAEVRDQAYQWLDAMLR